MKPWYDMPANGLLITNTIHRVVPHLNDPSSFWSRATRHVSCCGNKSLISDHTSDYWNLLWNDGKYILLHIAISWPCGVSKTHGYKRSRKFVIGFIAFLWFVANFLPTGCQVITLPTPSHHVQPESGDVCHCSILAYCWRWSETAHFGVVFQKGTAVVSWSDGVIVLSHIRENFCPCLATKLCNTTCWIMTIYRFELHPSVSTTFPLFWEPFRFVLINWYLQFSKSSRSCKCVCNRMGHISMLLISCCYGNLVM